MSVRGRTGGDDLQAVVTRPMTASAALRRVTTALQTGEFSIGTSGEDYCGTDTFIESFNGRLRDEYLNEHLFNGLASARRIIEAWRYDYNRDRPHTSLGGLTPIEFATRSTQDHTENRTNL